MAERVTQEERRRQILLAAVQVFGRSGFYEAKIEDVAQAAGLGKGTIYEYFRSKAELFQAMLNYVGERHLEELRSSAQGCRSAREKLAALAKAHLDLLLEHRDLARLIFYGHAALGETVHAWMLQQEEGLLELLAGVFREGVAGKEFRDLGEQFVARAFLGALGSLGAGLIFRSKPAEGVPDTAALAGRLADLFLNGLLS